ncbi:Uncharacterised protein [uncultured archaeon]|nr:Uncharacterised protein [uncultured archaeon]
MGAIAQAQSTEKYEAAAEKYQNSINKYTGNSGYQNALTQGQSGAQQAATGAAASAQGSARTSGMTKSQAAAMGNQSTINSYNSNLSNQQNMAYQSGLANVQSQSGMLNSQQAQAGTLYNQTRQGIGDVLSLGGSTILASDKRLKNYYLVSKKIKPGNKKNNDFSSLIIKKGENK